jgi:4-alpha-glucanotransferase
MTTPTRALRALAKAYGVRRTFRAAGGAPRHASDETLLTIVRLLGAPLDDVTGAPDALRAFEAARVETVVEPVLVQWGTVPLSVATPGAAGGEAVTVSVTTEAGDAHEWSLPAASDGTVTLPDAMPVGVHHVHVFAGGRGGEATLLAAPAKLPTSGRSWGVFAPMYALHDVRAATGDVAAFDRFSRWAGSLGARVMGTLPLLATFYGAGAEPNDPSPYAPVSRRHWNEVFLDLAAIPEVDGAAPVREPAPGEFVDLAALAARKRAVLTDALARLDEMPERRDAFSKWLAGRDDVRDYAAFRAEVETRAGDGAADHPSARYHAYAQWLIEDQLDALGTRLRERDQEIYLDLPIGAHPAGYDVQRETGLFAHGASVGAPPDLFFDEGQNWGFPPILPRVARATGHRYLRECIDAHVRFARWLRVDHVIGFNRMWWVPAGNSAKDGAYVEYPADEQYAVLAIAASRVDGHIVGENLGTVPPETNRALRTHGMLGMYVAQFEVDAERDEPLRTPGARDLACLDTHDTATFASWWDGVAGDERAALLAQLHAAGCLDGNAGDAPDAMAVQSALLAYLGASRAEVVLATLEDLWLETEAQNRPGTTSDERPNFRRRLAKSLDEIESSPGVSEVLARLDSTRAARTRRRGAR